MRTLIALWAIMRGDPCWACAAGSHDKCTGGRCTCCGHLK